MTTAALFVMLFAFMFLGMPVAVALGLSSLLTILAFGHDSLASLALKTTKELAGYDADARAVLEFLRGHESCTGHLGVMGICIGGHLAFRAAMNPDVLAAACFYATDIHKRGLGQGMNDNSLDRIPEIQGELLMIWGRQDPHVPLEGRRSTVCPPASR